jgi:hypothetical protein
MPLLTFFVQNENKKLLLQLGKTNVSVSDTRFDRVATRENNDLDYISH